MVDYDPEEVRTFVDSNGDTQTFIDSDTIHNNRTGVRTRLPGFDGLETSKLTKEDDKFIFEHGEIGGDLNTQVVADVVEQGGFNQIADTGNTDIYDRNLNPLSNEQGELLSDVLYKEGLAKLDRFSPEKNVTLKREGEVYRRLFGDKDSLFSDQRKAMESEEESQGLRFKRLAIDESEFDSNFHSGVQFRDHDRTIDNKPRDLLSSAAYSFGSGFDSIKEGAFGYLEAIGEMSEIELFENLGAQGGMRARSQIADTPELLLNYDQVDNLYTGFQYVVNNAAMSAPYMVTSFAALAAAIPLAAATGGGSLAVTAFAGLPTSIVYAGQTWNEMEGEKGIAQFTAASLSGVGQASLELLGLKGLIVPVKMFSAAGQKKVTDALMRKGLTAQQANTTFSNAVGKAQKQFLTGLDKVRFKPEDFANFSAANVAKAGAAGAIREGLTEVGQEGLAMATTAGFSETSYTPEEIQNRLTNAFIAGGSIGGTLGSSANAYMQSRNRLNKASYNRRDSERLSLFELYKIGKMQSGEGVSTIEQNIERSSRGRSIDPTLPTADVSVSTVEEAIAKNQSIVDNYNTTLSVANTEKRKLVDKQEKGIELETTEKIALDNYTRLERGAQPENVTRAKEQVKKLAKLREQGVVDYNMSSEINKAGSLSNEYIQKRKGLRNVIRNTESLADLVDVTAVGLGRLVRGAERSAIKAARAVANPVVLDILSRIGGALGDVVHSGMNAKEFQQSLITKAKLIVDEMAIASVFNVKALRYKTALSISKDLIAFGSTGGYTAYKVYKQQQLAPNLNEAVKEFVSNNQQLSFNNNLSAEEKLDLEKAQDYILNKLSELGFTTVNSVILAEEIKAYSQIVSSSQYSTNGIVTIQDLAQHLKVKIKADEISQPDLVELEKNYMAADRIKRSYDFTFNHTNEEYQKENNNENLNYNIDMWWKFQGFDWKKAKKNPVGFKKMLMKELDYSEADAQRIYDSISRRGEQTINAVEVTGGSEKVEYSLIDPNTTGIPFIFSEDAQRMMEIKDNKFLNGNLFATLNKVQVDAARYTANAKYFGQGGWKLHRLFRQLEAEGDLTREELTQFAFYIRSMINAMNGNYNRIENPKLAALNSFATSWSILAGLPLSAPASFPEFGMVYFDIKDDKMFQQASDQMIKQISSSFSKALDSEANKGRYLAEKVGLDSTASNIADRLATGERDVAFTRIHEAFFKGVGIQTITQLQRRIVSVVALDAIKSSFSVLEVAPTKLFIKGKEKPRKGSTVAINEVTEFEDRSVYDFDFDKFNEVEMQAYNQLTSLGIDVDTMMELMDDLDSMTKSLALNVTDNVSSHLRKEMVEQDDGQQVEVIKPPTQREAAIRKIVRKRVKDLVSEGENINDYFAEEITQVTEYIDNEIGNAIQRYVHERIQMPGHGNRPLFFQDPHYQLITQFNGFISAFTANIIPKLYDRGLRRGTIKTKYDTFALIVMLIVLGGASQLLKDMFKFGEPSPYLDTTGYIQRAVYASGVMGQYERVADIARPLYPQRDEGLEWLMNAVMGESGPTVRNVQNVFGATGDLLQGEGEKGIRNLLRSAPIVAPFTGARRQIAEGVTGTNPFKNTELPTESEVKDFFLGSY